jgi:hypothetical protein
MGTSKMGTAATLLSHFAAAFVAVSFLTDRRTTIEGNDGTAMSVRIGNV